ncbi:MAG TPA: cytochrome C oxidase subunit IV family protein [Terriglobales bacterium]|nr:cytochrome C oxidase subunit IV family protein [Terriglobales bacterium]
MSGHVVPLKVYFAIFATLMVLTALTVRVAFINLGPYNAAVALGIATTKAVLVILYFMHLRYSSKLTWIVVLAGFFWLGILLVITMTDYVTRSLPHLPT